MAHYWEGTDFEKDGDALWHEYHDQRCIHRPGRLKFSMDERAKALRLTTKVLNMNMAQRAEFADVVTLALCDKGPEMVMKIAISMMCAWSKMVEMPHSQYVADFSYVIGKLPDGEIKTQCIKTYKEVMGK